jgi:hypothetical protein
MRERGLPKGSIPNRLRPRSEFEGALAIFTTSQGVVKVVKMVKMVKMVEMGAGPHSVATHSERPTAE